ncbi:phospholipase D-like domain-containing protein, partial [Enterococcus sp. 3H8_DIV0648]|uniref:phospholipase D-like domain-containing protein n=2 Tax=Enterococcus TaxID=1350 RepID=UPI000B6B5074
MRAFSLLKKFTIVLLIYFLYFGLCVCFYNIHQINAVAKDAEKDATKSLKSLYNHKIQNESVCVTAELDQALALRCQLIDEAKESLLISQYAISNDDSGLIIVGKLLAAAQRGVKIKLLLNGLATEMSITSRIPFEIFREKENIEVKTIGGLNLFKPWEINNVLHDKLILVDDNYFI